MPDQIVATASGHLELTVIFDTVLPMLTKQEEHDIQAFVDAIRVALPGYRERPSQRLMMDAVAEVLDCCRHGEDTQHTDGSNFLVCESGTGTGKTFSYTIPGIVLAKSVGKKLVISTSTIALQEQLTQKDLPLLQAHAPFGFTFALAKGRARYVCPSKLRAQAARASQWRIDLEGKADEDADPAETEMLGSLAARLASGAWDGDRDQLTEDVPATTWASITTDRTGCSGNRCTDFATCPFYRARQQVRDADVIVGNHDLVLCALEAPAGSVLPDPAECYVAVDEGHVLPLKVIAQSAQKHAVRPTYALAADVPSVVLTTVHALKLDFAWHRNALAAGAALSEAVGCLITWLATHAAEGEGAILRFENGVVPADLQSIGEPFRACVECVVTLLADLRAEVLKGARDLPEIASALMTEIGALLVKAEALHATWDLLLTPDPQSGAPAAKWIETTDDDHVMAAAPIMGAHQLTRALWRRASAVVVTSATLTACGSFNLFLQETGLHRFPNLKTLRLDSPFDYASRGRLIVPHMRTDPGDPDAHTVELIERLPAYLDVSGALVLFTSAKKMRAVHEVMPDGLKAAILLQGTLTKTEIVRRHKAIVDAGGCSVIFGLSSFAEGVDLPGDYCSRVVITQLPFPVPAHPWEQARREWLERNGKSAFHEVTLPEAAVKLAQAVGRLIRTEADEGEVVILDTRIVKRRYGAALLASLPPMQREIFGRASPVRDLRKAS